MISAMSSHTDLLGTFFSELTFQVRCQSIGMYCPSFLSKSMELIEWLSDRTSMEYENLQLQSTS